MANSKWVKLLKHEIAGPKLTCHSPFSTARLTFITLSAMEPSSPPLPPSDFPPSSGPDPFEPTPRSGSAPRRPLTNALTLDDDAEEDDGAQTTGPGRKRPRQRTQANGDVPLVKDAVGETLGESFESFLRSCVGPLSRRAFLTKQKDSQNQLL